MKTIARIVIGFIYLVAALSGCARGGYIWLDEINGRPWSWWIVILLGGGAVLVIAAILEFRGLARPSNRLGVIGSLMLACFYIPALRHTLSVYFSPSANVYDPAKLFLVVGEPFVVMLSLVLGLIAMLRGPQRNVGHGSA